MVRCREQSPEDATLKPDPLSLIVHKITTNTLLELPISICCFCGSPSFVSFLLFFLLLLSSSNTVLSRYLSYVFSLIHASVTTPKLQAFTICLVDFLVSAVCLRRSIKPWHGRNNRTKNTWKGGSRSNVKRTLVWFVCVVKSYKLTTVFYDIRCVILAWFQKLIY